ncbi:3-phytase A precursor (histidine acid phosphatase) [Colletotrichum tofieldiae]|uniref:3-phytase n=1 Tax=Colletotrichum tofieldiae TaxID=708197 RepID=A0A166UGN2_9PEZI|nr:3-phytase A precursor (histidine acid phosphatase) [Colletotrichum tofieldiae]
MAPRQGGYLRVPGQEEDFSRQQQQQQPGRGRSGSAGRRKKPLPSEKPLPALPPPTPSHTAGFVDVDLSGGIASTPSSRRRATIAIALALAVVGCMLAFVVLGFAWDNGGVRRGPGALDNLKNLDDCPCRPDDDVPQYFRTSPELWAGPTATGRPAFMAQTRVLPTGTFVPNQPLQTDIPIEGMGSKNESIFNMMGYLTPYQPSPGFGVDEYALPAGAEIVQVQMLSRHGSRYPTSGSNVASFGERIAKAGTELKAKGALKFLNDWKYQLGHEILVPKGRQELFDSGILHSYMYSSLYNTNSKLIVRTTVSRTPTYVLHLRAVLRLTRLQTQDRMLKSAEYWLAGFFGLEWTNNATIEVIIEQDRANNSLAGYLNCPNARKQNGGDDAAQVWISNYLANATARLRGMADGYDWNINDTYAAQTMCPYETVAYGFSLFCDLFTYEEWVGFSYSVDLAFAGNNAFQNPAGRAMGIGYQQEVIARLQNHTLGYSGSQINVTLDNNTVTFPLNQSLYFDFSHDTNIASILTAFGLKQFSQLLQPTEYPGPHNFTVSHITPFGARLDIEIIKTPKPFKADRSGYDEDGGETKYVHFILNQRTVPLGWSFPECDAERKDGWCEFETFLKVQEDMPELADYDRACHGDIETVPYGVVYDGRPL